MSDTSMTTIKLKQINKNKVYTGIYTARSTCKLLLTQSLKMGLSTVTQNLKILEEEGLIHKNGSFQSTGGRKADALEIVAAARLSIGVALLERELHIVAADLYGNALHSQAIPIPFQASQLYYSQVGDHIRTFISTHQLEERRILGVSIATQGIISADGQSVTYGVLLHNASMHLSDLQSHIPFPCRLVHDSKAAAKLELWHNQSIQSGVVLLLNRNLGGAIIAQRAIQNGDNMRSGTIEHLCMNPDGALCYCGRRGCLETYCSANSLAQAAGTSIPDFFRNLRHNNKIARQIWTDYLNYLALAIRNLSVVVDGTFVLSGYLAPYFQPEDLSFLVERINTLATFPLQADNIVLGHGGQFTQAIGASLHFIEEFLAQV